MVWELLARAFGSIIEMLMHDEEAENKRNEELIKRLESRLGLTESDKDGGQDEPH